MALLKDETNVKIQNLKKELRILKQSFDFAVSKPIDLKDKEDFPHIVFEVESEFFAWPAVNLREIVVNQKIIAIPGNLNMICGVFNYKNYVMPIVNLRYLLGLPLEEIGKNNLIMVTKGLSVNTSICVDKLIVVLSIAKEDIKPKPVSLGQDIDAIIQGEIFYKSKMVTLLNPSYVVGS